MGIKKKLKLAKWIATGIIAVAITGYIAYKAMRPSVIAYKSVKAPVSYTHLPIASTFVENNIEISMPIKAAST